MVSKITGLITGLGLALTPLATLLFGLPAEARLCADLFRNSARHLSQPEISRTYQNSIELEIPPTDRVFDILTTTDGTLAPLAPKHAAEAFIPSPLLDTIRESFPQENPLALRFDLLSTKEKEDVITSSAIARRHRYGQDRSIPGLKFQPEVPLVLKRSYVLGGRLYGPGPVRIPSKLLFGETDIEFMSERRMTADLGFEIHLRTDLPAGEALALAREVATNLVGQPANVHQHVVGPYPFIQNGRKTSNEVDVYRMVDFATRTSFVFDLFMIERGIPMTLLTTENGQLSSGFGPSSMKATLSLLDLLEHEGLGANVFSKAGTVGIRSHHYYDSNVWGLEVRYLPAAAQSMPPATAKAFDERQQRTMTDIHSRITGGRLTISEKEAEQLLAKAKLETENDPTLYELVHVTARKAHVSRGLSLATSRLFPDKYPNPGLSFGFTPNQTARLMIQATLNDHVKYLFTDWSKSPWFQHWTPERHAHIRTLQKNALNEILILHHRNEYGRDAATPKHTSTEALKRFMQRSGIAHEILSNYNALAQPSR
ncbi:MAG: hypothetical protein RBT63_10965 [Bdellovibrionales bacterium]|nr:hypothetical protein [Bdellovibrionales bacterium]